MSIIFYVIASLWFIFLAIDMGYIAYITIHDDRRREKDRKESIERDIF